MNLSNPRTREMAQQVPGAIEAWRALVFLRHVPSYLAAYVRFRQLNRHDDRFPPARFGDLQPCLADRTVSTGFDRHYVYHTAWAARVVQQVAPTFHVDISSSLYFSGIISAFVPVKFYDYRPANLQLSNLASDHADLCQLPFSDSSIQSLSCMHVVEHIGLGRYGDPIDPQGDRKAMSELQRVLAPGGSLLFVTPVGKPRICFNANRIYSYEMIIESMPQLTLKEFALIPDDPAKGIIRHADPSAVLSQSYACGCFWFMKEGR